MVYLLIALKEPDRNNRLLKEYTKRLKIPNRILCPLVYIGLSNFSCGKTYNLLLSATKSSKRA